MCPDRPRPILILGGTGEATRLAEELTVRGFRVVVSFAGLTDSATLPSVPRRIGGFGGIPGLVRALLDGGYRLLIDASHPFASQITGNAAAAANLAGIPWLRLLRPPWRATAGDQWHHVNDLPAVATTVTELGARRVFLSIGGRGAARFAHLDGVHVVVRSVQPVTSLPTTGATVIVARGPFTVESEISVLRDHRIEALVTRVHGHVKVPTGGQEKYPVVAM
jgi:precorrin-6A/cobalt-precorrin-6A reductase